MFYLRFKIERLVETLRKYAEHGAAASSSPKDSSPSPKGESSLKSEKVPPRHGGAITEDHELCLLFHDIFDNPSKLNNPIYLRPEGRRLWFDLIEASKQKRPILFDRALELADWLEKEYTSKEPMQFDTESWSVMLNGDLFENLDPDAVVLLMILYAKNPEPVTADAVVQHIVHGDVNHEVDRASKRLAAFKEDKDGADLQRLKRAIRSLPQELKSLIKNAGREGRWLHLPLR